jgi:hypothetical protein
VRLALYIVFVALPAWGLRLGIFLPLAILGIPLITWQGGHVTFRPSRYFSGRLLPQFRSQWMRLYRNEEDGIDGLRGGDAAQRWWAAKTSGWSDYRRIFVWSALRNPVDSLRWVPLINPTIDPALVRFVGMDREPRDGEGGWYFAWLAGTPYSCIRYETKHFRFWLGWKLHPEDRNGLQPGDYRAIRCDFACQLKRVA